MVLDVPQYLTQLLVDNLKSGGPGARVVFTTSPSESKTGDIDFENLECVLVESQHYNADLYFCYRFSPVASTCMAALSGTCISVGGGMALHLFMSPVLSFLPFTRSWCLSGVGASANLPQSPCTG